MASSFDELTQRIITCRKCPRLVAWREEVATLRKKRAFQDQEYWGKPVPGHGDPLARVFLVGLAPGAHGSNRTGRNFTGDSSADFLYPALYRAGFANQPTSTSRDDGLVLRDLYMSAACKCVPPQNKPNPDELATCHPYLEEEISLLPNLRGFVALGKIAFDAVLTWYRARGVAVNGLTFAHAAIYHPSPDLPWLATLYHPSRQNTQTGKLTVEMFDLGWEKIKKLVTTEAQSSQSQKEEDEKRRNGNNY